MKIAATAVSMDAARKYTEVEQQITGFTFNNGGALSRVAVSDFGTRLTSLVSSSTRSTLQAQSTIHRQTAPTVPSLLNNSSRSPGAVSVLSLLTEQTLGQQVTLDDVRTHGPPDPPGIRSGGRPLQIQRAQLSSQTIYSEVEKIAISASGTVETADGREISFEFGYEMQRQTVEVCSISMDASPALFDPIILNFDGSLPFLSDCSFLFDLDADGQEDTVASPGSGCGFLALDRNCDGLINDGLELFGPASGSGFGELADLDLDANMWIDENDPIFDRLLVWMKGENGEDSLLSLQEAGVGAISIAGVRSEFQLESPSGVLLGQIKASGIFLTEEGEVRSLQEVDLATDPSLSPGIMDGEEYEDIEVGQAMESMRGIIALQRFQLRMILARRRMLEASERMALLFDHLHRQPGRPVAAEIVEAETFEQESLT